MGVGVNVLGQTEENILVNRLQRKLRTRMTDTERALWQVLRHGQVPGTRFRRQHPFGKFILDFACLRTKLVIELDGGQHQQQVDYDEVRSKVLEAAGFKILRFWNNEVLQHPDAVRERIWMAVQEIQPHPHPCPPLEREGELEEDG